MPSIPALYEDPAFVDFKDDFFGGQQIAVEFGKAANRVKPVYYGPLHDQTDTFFKNALKNVIEKKPTLPKSGMKQLNKRKPLRNAAKHFNKEMMPVMPDSWRAALSVSPVLVK